MRWRSEHRRVAAWPSRCVRTAFVVLSFLLVSLCFSAEETAQSHFQRASKLAEQGHLNEAEHEYKVGLKLAPDSADAYNNLGVIYFQRQDFKQAILAYAKACQLRPENPEFHFNLGLAQFKAGNCKAAIPHLRGPAA